MTSQDQKRTSITSLISPTFYKLHWEVFENKYVHYWLKGGRGSTKSSFIALEIIFNMMNDARNNIHSNAIALRKVGLYIKDSVFEQLEWAIDVLGVNDLWESRISPMSLTYIKTGQKILFRGADKPKKIKSTKFKKGYCKYLWYEEVDEFNGMEEIRNINQTLMRGGELFVSFYSYNPPKSIKSWVNDETLIKRDDKRIHHSTYIKVPKHWLGDQFILEAEHLKKVNETAYKHEYLGEVTGTGGEVFKNITIRTITDDEIKVFDKIKRGIDFGYAMDPFAYGVMHYDKTRKRLYIFYEIFKTNLSNRQAIQLVKSENTNNNLIIADSAEPKSIDEFRANNIHINGAKKGPDSVEYGIKFLQDLEEIIIDDKRCPNAAREFLHYELEKDSNGNFKASYPDKNNHYIDLTRYALESEMSNKQGIYFV